MTRLFLKSLLTLNVFEICLIGVINKSILKFILHFIRTLYFINHIKVLGSSGPHASGSKLHVSMLM